VTVDAGGVHVNQAEGQTLTSPTEQKMLIFSVIGKSVVIASSRSLMDRAVTSYTTGKSSIAQDPTFLPMLKKITGGAQQVFIVDVPGIMERLRKVLSGTLTDPNGTKPDDVIKLFGSEGNGLVFSAGCADNRSSGILFIPVDYDRAIHLISLTKSGKKGAIQ